MQAVLRHSRDRDHERHRLSSAFDLERDERSGERSLHHGDRRYRITPPVSCERALRQWIAPTAGAYRGPPAHSAMATIARAAPGQGSRWSRFPSGLVEVIERQRCHGLQRFERDVAAHRSDEGQIEQLVDEESPVDQRQLR
jgi:hypothetical protein